MIDAALRMRILLLSGDDLVPLIRNRQPAAPTNRHKSVKIVELRPNPPWTLRAGPWDVDVHRGVEIGQIAALPYWSSGPTLDSPGRGASLMADVEVFPLAVNREFDDWPEKAERERRWFSLADAAAMLDEPDLADLIRSFGASEFHKAAQRTGMLSVVAEKSKLGPMFAWFQRLLLRTGGLFELFEAHAVAVLAAADATGRLFQGGPKCHEHIREIREREHDADEIVREMLKTICQTFLTPFDRGAITALIGSMDEAIDEMQSAASAVDVYQMTEFDAPMRDMVAIAVDAARLGWSRKRCRCCATLAGMARACTN